MDIIAIEGTNYIAMWQCASAFIVGGILAFGAGWSLCALFSAGGKADETAEWMARVVREGREKK